MVSSLLFVGLMIGFICVVGLLGRLMCIEVMVLIS